MIPQPTKNADNFCHPIQKLTFRRAIPQPTKNAGNLCHLIQKLTFRRVIPQPTKNTVNLCHLIQKLAFRIAIPQPTKNNENSSYPIQKLAFRRAIPQPTKNAENFSHPTQKARIQERETAANQKQRQKFMTEEEKKIEAQIEEYAANLPSAIDIDQLTVEFLRDFFYKHPTLALVYYHCCSVGPRASI